MHSGDVIALEIQTRGRVHAENDAIMTIPEGFRPMVDFRVPAKAGTNDICLLNVGTNGVVSVWSIPSDSGSGRLITEFTYIK